MTTAVATRDNQANALERVLIAGDIGKLTSEQRVEYYMNVCNSVGLNPLTQPFEYLTLQGKTVLYAKKTCTDQLRAIHKISVTELSKSVEDGVLVVTAKVQNGDGRTDVEMGAVALGTLKGDALANAMMKASTKAKRRATLSICGLGMLDETEVETIPGAVTGEPPAPAKVVNPATGRPVNPNSSAQQKKNGSFERFEAKLAEFTDAQALLEWWESEDTQANILRLPEQWRAPAQDKYEVRMEQLDA